MALLSRYCSHDECEFCFDRLCEHHCHTDREELPVAAILAQDAQRAHRKALDLLRELGD